MNIFQCSRFFIIKRISSNSIDEMNTDSLNEVTKHFTHLFEINISLRKRREDNEISKLFLSFCDRIID